MKILYKPFAIIAGVIASKVGQSIFKALWSKIDQAEWAGLRCRVKIAGDVNGCSVDLRDKVSDPATSLCGTKPVAKDGSAALVVEQDAREGTATMLVLLDESGAVIDKMPVTVGG